MIPFNFSDEVNRVFTTGLCGNLALELNERYGLEIYSIFFGSLKDNVPVHYVAKLSDGRYVDIMGIWSLDELVAYWKAHPDNDEHLCVSMKATGKDFDNPDYVDDMAGCPVKDRQLTKEVVSRIHSMIFEDNHPGELFSYPDSSSIQEKTVGDVCGMKVKKVLTDNVFLLNDGNVAKFIIAKKHPFHGYSNVSDDYLLQRSIDGYMKFSNEGIGPKVYDIRECVHDGEKGIVVVMEYIPIKSTNELVEEKSDQIREAIKIIHDNGIYHGDLHGSNIGFRVDGSLVFLDPETYFTTEDLHDPVMKEIIEKWASNGFEMSVSELIDYELNENWNNVIDDI